MKNLNVLKDLPFAKKGDILPCNSYGIWLERKDLPSAYVPMRIVEMWVNDGYLKWVEDKSLAQQIFGFLEDNDVSSDLITNITLAEGCSQISERCYEKKFDEARNSKISPFYDTYKSDFDNVLDYVRKAMFGGGE